jgi:type II secretory pathway pseudopilin PulG
MVYACHSVRKRGRVGAFTLLEAMIAIAISGVIAAAATTATMGIYATLAAKERQGSADEELRALTDLISTRIFQVGGGAVRPWSALSSNCWRNTACTQNGGSTLKFIDVNENLQQATITSVDASLRSVVIAQVAGRCPTDAWPELTSVVLVPAVQAGGGWATGRCRKQAPCSCQLEALTAGPARGTLPAAPSPNEMPAPDIVASRTFPAGHFATGTIAPAEVVAITFDAATHSLIESRDFGQDGRFLSRRLSDQVYEFRVQYGFDANENGYLDPMEPLSTERQPWTSIFDPRDVSLQPAATKQATSTLRSLRFGLIVGAPASTRSLASRASIFAETAASETAVNSTSALLLRASTSVVTMRSLLVFN